ncbi:UNVERIFIED_CONTAM: hypothetical protein HDU68_006421, partial [Siphonaria sp. JEL0065]
STSTLTIQDPRVFSLPSPRLLLLSPTLMAMLPNGISTTSPSLNSNSRTSKSLQTSLLRSLVKTLVLLKKLPMIKQEL